MLYAQCQQVDGVFPEFLDLLRREQVAWRVRVNFCSVEDLGAVDVADSGDYVLVHK